MHISEVALACSQNELETGISDICKNPVLCIPTKHNNICTTDALKTVFHTETQMSVSNKTFYKIKVKMTHPVPVLKLLHRYIRNLRRYGTG